MFLLLIGGGLILFCYSGAASTVGMGNITGVAIAITVGGPDAIFRMWISAMVGCYMLLVLVIILLNLDKIPGVFASIFHSAFSFEAGLVCTLTALPILIANDYASRDFTSPFICSPAMVNTCS